MKKLEWKIDEGKFKNGETAFAANGQIKCVINWTTDYSKEIRVSGYTAYVEIGSKKFKSVNGLIISRNREDTKKWCEKIVEKRVKEVYEDFKEFIEG